MSAKSKKNLKKVFSFLETDYGYNIANTKDVDDYPYISITYKKTDSNDIFLESERFYPSVTIKVNNEFFGLSKIYHFLYPNELLRMNYYHRKDFKHIGDDTRKYLNAFFDNKDKITEEKLTAFYEEHSIFDMAWL